MKWILVIVVIMTMATLWMLIRAEDNEALAEVATPPLGQIILVGDQKLHVKISGSGPPIVMLHGASGNLRDLTMGLAPAIQDKFTTIAIDRPGLGYSAPIGRHGATLKQQGDLITSAMRQLGYDRFYLLGQSYGGSVALNMTLEHPEQVAGLVLVSAPSNVWPTGLGTLYKINSNPITGPILRLFVSAFPPKTLVHDSLSEIFAPQPILDDYDNLFGVGLTLRRSTQRANSLQVARLKEQVRDMVPRYGEINIPVEAVHGDADTVVPYTVHTEKLALQIANITVTKLPGVGHMPHHTHMNKVIAAIMRLHGNVALPDAAPQE